MLVATDVHSVGFIVDGVSQQGERLKGGVIVEYPHMEVHSEGGGQGGVACIARVSGQAVAPAH